MKIRNIDSNTSFGKIYCGDTVLNRLGKADCSQEFMNGYKAVRTALESRNLHNLKNVNLTINYANKDGFFATASNKKFGIPEYRQYKHKISTDANHLDIVEEWAHNWDCAFAAMKDNAIDTASSILRFICENYKF